jgi:hypothetical protein
MLERWGKDAERVGKGYGKVGERMGARMVKGLFYCNFTINTSK